MYGVITRIRAIEGRQTLMSKMVSTRKKPERVRGEGRVRARRMSPEARRAQLLQVALGVFADRGIEGCGHTDLADAAQVAVPTTFHYFPTKEDLIAAVLEEVERFLVEDILIKYIGDDYTAAESLEEMLMAFCDTIDSNPDHIRVWLEWSVSIRGDTWGSYLLFYAKVIKGIKKILRRGLKDGSIKADLDLDDAARVVMGVCHMVVHMKFANNTRDTVQHTIHSLISGYFTPAA
jgi:TetR/AcrR family transcriptional regulator, hemagglutinin/protease regulatory protein